VLVGNLMLLLCIVTLPFTTALMATYLSAPGPDGHLAAAIYAGSFLLRSAIAPPRYLLAGLLGLVMPLLTLVVCIALGMFYLLAPLARQRGGRLP
jgi:hypothetical protein